MTHEMIERVARILSPQSWQALGTSCDTKAKKKRREASLDYAKRCILVMREPTDDMIDAAYDGDSLELGSSAYGCWQEMVDQVLK